MTNVQAAMSEGTNMGKAYTDKNQAFVFRIPVYQNMPESAVTFADKGNPNKLAFLDHGGRICADTGIFRCEYLLFPGRSGQRGFDQCGSDGGGGNVNRFRYWKLFAELWR